MPQVIIVSNRLPVIVSKDNGELAFAPSLGGIATGLASYVDDPANQWIGWPGIASDGLSEQDKQAIVEELATRNCTPVFLSQKQIDEFYNGYSNEVLWPLFHGLPAKKHNAETLKRWWQTYRSINKRYADAVSAQANSGSQIWVHDYQLLLLPEMLRAERTGRQLGFFLHIPFPSTKALVRLPEYKKLLRGILGADLVGFHTTSYANAFMENCLAAKIGIVGDKQIVLPDHTVRVAEFPMGIDYAKYAAAGKSKTVKAAVRRYRKRYRRRKVIVAVDRLDPTKGLAERLKAYRLFLEFFPKRRGKVVFAMVAAPSRTGIKTYQNLAKRLNKLVDEINADFGTPRWQPVDYMNIVQPFEEVTALFQVADVAFIAPLKDGMNLAAKEFVASNRKRGVLILSETAGAAEELQDALIVNPRRPEDVVDALQQALTMRRGELRGRLKRMQKQLSINTVQNWAKTFVDTLQQPVPGTPHITRGLNKRWQKVIQTDYRQARKRLLLLDYDGSLVPFSNNYQEAKPPKALLELLKTLGADLRNELVLISGRSAEDLTTWFGDLGINLVAEHGAAVKPAGNKTWRTIEKTDTTWKQLLQPALEKYVRLTPGARLEVKPHSIVWHYRGAAPYQAQKYTVIIKRALKPLLKKYNLELLQGNKALEIKNPRISKGAAAQRWLRKDYEFVLCVGDDATDEELFATLPITAHSVKVGRGLTAARFRLSNYKSVLELLKKLSKTA